MVGFAQRLRMGFEKMDFFLDIYNVIMSGMWVLYLIVFSTPGLLYKGWEESFDFILFISPWVISYYIVNCISLLFSKRKLLRLLLMNMPFLLVSLWNYLVYGSIYR